MKNFATKLLLCALLAGTSSFDVSGMKRKFEEDQSKEIKEDKKEDENLGKVLDNSSIEHNEIKHESKIPKYLENIGNDEEMQTHLTDFHNNLDEKEIISDMEKLSKKTFIETVHYFTFFQKELLELVNVLKIVKLEEIADITQKVYTLYTEVLKNLSDEITYEEAMAKITTALAEANKKLMSNPFALLELIKNLSPKQFIAILDLLIKNTAETINLYEKDGFKTLASTTKKAVIALQLVIEKIEETETVELNDIMSLISRLKLQ